MTVAVYCRVSTNDQTNLNQEIRLVEYCQKMGWNQYHIFNEVESSRKTRPVKACVLDLLRKKKYDTLLIYSLSRWARSSLELISEMQELTEKGVGFISYSENLDLSSSTGKLHFAILAAFSEFERELIRERTIEGLNRARAQGKKLGRPRLEKL